MNYVLKLFTRYLNRTSSGGSLKIAICLSYIKLKLTKNFQRNPTLLTNEDDIEAQNKYNKTTVFYNEAKEKFN